MFPFVLLVVCSVGVLANDLPLQPTENNDQQLAIKDKLDLKDLCFFGTLPSSACDDKCRYLRMESYCYPGTNECLCRPPKTQKNPLPSGVQEMVGDHPKSTPETLDDTQQPNTTFHLIFFISEFIELQPMTEAEDEDYEEGDEDWEKNSMAYGMHPSPKPIRDDSGFLWTKENVAIVLILAAILALVVVELCIMYRKRQSKNHLEHLFKTTSLGQSLVK